MVQVMLLTSVHVEELSLEVRETKRGMEELTSDIPNVSEEATKDLDENGIIRIGDGPPDNGNLHRATPHPFQTNGVPPAWQVP